MALPKKRPKRYSPLSIDEYSHDDDDPLVHSRNTRSSYNTRRLSALLLLLACLSGSALLVAKDYFHVSLPNLLRIIFGVHSKSTLEAVCLEDNYYHDDSAKMIHNNNVVSMDEMECNRNAMAFNQSMNGFSSRGFVWDDDDASTTAWRPQGITTHHTDNSRWVLISWYGRKDEGYANRGGRITFVDITQMDQQQQCYSGSNSNCSYPYVHVLLVDANYCTLPNIHVGGIEAVNGTLYVADSRNGVDQILQFQLNYGLFDVSSNSNTSDTAFFGYRYVLQQSGSFASPTKPSFLSYDVDSRKFVIGTYSRCGPKVGIHTDSSECFSRHDNRLVWFDPMDVDYGNSSILDSNNATSSFKDELFSSCWHYFSEMQGAASVKINGDTFVFVSSSYGPIADSHLHVIHMSSSFPGNDCSNDTQLDDIVELRKVNVYSFPPGLEDLHIESSGVERYIWMNTEFGKRMVFSTHLDDVVSHGILS